jgi:hypothetical protein
MSDTEKTEPTTTTEKRREVRSYETYSSLVLAKILTEILERLSALEEKDASEEI